MTGCEEFRARSREFAYERLEASAAAECSAHLGSCPACGAWFGKACGLTCRELTEFLHEYVDGGLDPERRGVFEAHLHLCVECEAFLDGYRRTTELSRDLADATAEEAPARLVAAILAARNRGSGPAG